ncbi:MAG: IS110 family transposase [Actinomycetes bacterium]|jgi:transposase
MTTMPQPVPTRVTVGVDTHADIHVAVAKDSFGRRLDAISVPTTPAGYAELLGWARRLGQPDAWGIEGTGSFGAGLARFLRAQGQVVVEVNRPDRQARRRRGKSDPLDAEAAARAVQAREGSIPKAGDGQVEMIRSLRVARASAIKARTQAINALKALVVTAPAELREQLRGLSTVRLIQTTATLEPGPVTTPLAAARLGLQTLGRRYQALSAELSTLDAELDRLTRAAAPKLLARFGVGADSAGALLVAAGDNPERLRSDAAFAMLCGASPIEASSGKTRRYRLNRGGDRQANAALYRIVVARLRHHQPTKDYLARRIREGKSKKEAIRCLKRYVAREVFAVLPRMGPRLPGHPANAT